MDFKIVDGILKYPVSLFLPGLKPRSFPSYREVFMTELMLIYGMIPIKALTGVQAGELEARCIGCAVWDDRTPRKRF